MPPRLRPDAPEACYGKPEPKRGPYVSDDQPVYQPVPDRCPRCRGLVVTSYHDTFCVCCGWHRQPLPLPQEPTMKKSGPVLPHIMEVG